MVCFSIDIMEKQPISFQILALLCRHCAAATGADQWGVLFSACTTNHTHFD